MKSGCWMEGVFHRLGWARRPMISLSKNIPRSGPRNCRSLGFPGFPVELGGVGELHAPFLTERRTRGPGPEMRGRKSGFARDDTGEGDASMKSGCWIEGVFHHLGWGRRPMTTPVGMTIPFRCQNLDFKINLSSRRACDFVDFSAVSRHLTFLFSAPVFCATNKVTNSDRSVYGSTLIPGNAMVVYAVHTVRPLRQRNR
jgi:hypothetical protein